MCIFDCKNCGCTWTFQFNCYFSKWTNYIYIFKFTLLRTLLWQLDNLEIDFLNHMDLKLLCYQLFDFQYPILLFEFLPFFLLVSLLHIYHLTWYNNVYFDLLIYKLHWMQKYTDIYMYLIIYLNYVYTLCITSGGTYSFIILMALMLLSYSINNEEVGINKFGNCLILAFCIFLPNF